MDQAAVPYAIATSAIRAKLEMSLDTLGLRARFRVTATADDVEHSKPDPAVFLLCARRLGLAPPRLAVFEDSVNGIEGANAAGMFSIGIVGTFPREQLSHARVLIGDFREIDCHALSRWLDGHAQ
jgi:beta-phosphoglucomutase-like phosphatase (HAD superfamily)